MIATYILAGMAAEGAALAIYRAVTGRGPKALVANFAAGAALLVAWIAADAGASTFVVYAALAAAGVAHGADLIARWREPAAVREISKATIRMRADRRHGVNRPSET